MIRGVTIFAGGFLAGLYVERVAGDALERAMAERMQANMEEQMGTLFADLEDNR